MTGPVLGGIFLRAVHLSLVSCIVPFLQRPPEKDHAILCESTGFPKSAGGNLVTKPFPNVFEEPLKNLQT